MQKVSQASVVLAVAGITVDAKDDKAVTFYEHFGFYTVAMSNVKPEHPEIHRCINLDPKADEYVADIFGKHYAVIDNIARLPERLPQLFMSLVK